MLKFYHQGKLVCHVSTIGANIAQVKACRELVAEKMGVNLYNIKMKF